MSGRSTARGYWTGFSVCLVVVVLAVFSWVVQRRLAQYESIQQAGGHHMVATKVCLTDRNQISGPSLHAVKNAFAGSAMLFAAIFMAFGLSMTVPLKGLSGTWRYCRGLGARVRPGLTFFFFLPPPSFSSAM